MNDRYECKKCGMKFKEKPTGHGSLTITIYPNEPKEHEECHGEICKINQEVRK